MTIEPTKYLYKIWL